MVWLGNVSCCDGNVSSCVAMVRFCFVLFGSGYVASSDVL